MHQIDRTMPTVLKELYEREFDYADGNGIDFEPYAEFLSEDATRSWFRAWTRNKELDGSEYLVFGQDGTGGYAAFWCVRPDRGVLEQPIVFFGSEGDLGVIASDFSHYLWLLAGGFGPYEAVAYSDERRAASPVFTAFAIEHAGIDAMSPIEVLSKARSEFPSFEQDVQAVCR